MRIINLLIFSCVAIVLSGCGTPEERAAAHMQTAQESFDEGDYINARLEVRNAAQIEPKNVKARYLLALLAEQDQKPREMLQHLLVAVELDPDMVEARVKLGSLYVIGRAYELAAEHAAAAVALAPDDPDVQVLRARLMLQQAEREQALGALERALDLDPDHVPALGIQALVFQEAEPDRALDMLEQAIVRLDRDASRPLRQLKLDILTRHGRTGEVEQALLAMIADVPGDDSIYQERLARFYRSQGRMDEAESMLRDIAAEAGDDVRARLDVVQFLAEVHAPETGAEALLAFIEEDSKNQQLILALGDFHLKNGRHDEAVLLFSQVAELDPLSADGLLARVKLAAARVRNGDTKDAETLLLSILADVPDYPRALLMRAGLLFSERRYDDVIGNLRVLLRKEPGNQQALLMIARSHIETGDTVLGKDAYRRLLDLNPGFAAAARELVVLVLQDDEPEEAEAILDQLLAADGSENVAASILVVELLMQQENWPAAETKARELAAGVDPTGIGSAQLGQVFEGQQRYEEAAGAYAQALEKSPDSIPMLQGLARSLIAQGQHDEMLTLLNRRAAEYPDNMGIRLMLGGALTDDGQTSAALDVFESVIAEQPGLSPAYVAIASLYPDDVVKRVRVLRRGLDALPGNMPISSLLVNEYQREGRFAELIALYEGLLVVHPENLEVMNNLVATLADHRFQDPADVERMVELADRLAGTDNPLIMDTVGWAYYRGGIYDRAVRYLERAVAEVSEFPTIHYHLGMAYLAAGNRVGAKQELEKAVASGNADFDGVEEARKVLATLGGG